MKKLEELRQICTTTEGMVTIASVEQSKADALEKIDATTLKNVKDVAKLAKVVAKYCAANKATSIAANVRYIYTMLGLDAEGINIWEKMTGLKHNDDVLHLLLRKENLTKMYVELKIGSIYKTAYQFAYYRWETSKGKIKTLHYGIPGKEYLDDEEWKKDHAYIEVVPESKMKNEEKWSSLWRKELLVGMKKYKKPIMEWEIMNFIRINLNELGVEYKHQSGLVKVAAKPKVNTETGEVAC